MSINWSSIKSTAVRLCPGDDLKSQLAKLASDNRLRAASVISAVGSLTKATLRLAGGSESKTFQGKHEILSLTGTLSIDGIHLHMSLANSNGQTIGGHLMEGCTIFTTAEIVIVELNDLVFKREFCEDTGFTELNVFNRESAT